MASLQGSMGMGTKKDESSTGHIWAAGFHHFMTRSCLACIFKLMNCLVLQFSKFFSGCSKPQITETVGTGGSACILILRNCVFDGFNTVTYNGVINC